MLRRLSYSADAFLSGTTSRLTTAELGDGGPRVTSCRLYSITCNFQEQKLSGFYLVGKKEVYPCIIERANY